MSLQIQMLGTGSAFAKTFYNTSALIRSNGMNILIDCGLTTPKSLYDIHMKPDQIDGIVISHIHADHVGGLEEIAFRLLYESNQKKTKLFLTKAIADILWENTLRGGMYNPEEGYYSLEDYFDVNVMEEREPFEIGPGLSVEFIPTLHIPRKPNYSLFINDRIFYSADIRFNKDLLIHEVVDKRNCHTIFHDCQLSGQGFIHATLGELLTLPEHIQQRMYLMHYADNMGEFIGKTGSMKFVHQHQVIEFPE
ncbi:MBL fold metallo-hydrolase [Paenibacillus planticolens]|uniref:MBL fold metallo-hydrolase n=1 Tax=Paenibacillus planticolens TaxID=2654976 RepID=A0ABX1ZTI6_9BACL|nr:MBL fold metallo-hydrolase [Paenibacillus planticolens]NOV03344.1 MBL fold metallo-hydrolase [Paenibacillus planticolens]